MAGKIGPFSRVESYLQGKPNTWLTIALLLTAVFLVAVALFAPATLKAGMLLWTWLP